MCCINFLSDNIKIVYDQKLLKINILVFKIYTS